MARYQNVERLTDLTRHDYLAPFVLSWTEPYAMTPTTVTLADSRHPGTQAGPQLQVFLDQLLPTIDQYPYTWPLNGQRLDSEGYAFTYDSQTDTLDISLVAYKEAIRQLGLPPADPVIQNPYRGGQRVYAPHLTKLQLTLEKASPLSTLSFQFFAKHPVKLLSLVAERDLAGNNLPVAIDLTAVQTQQNDDTLTLLFGEPVFAKRLTFVLGQDAASANTYTVKRSGEDFTYAPTDGDKQRLLGYASRYHHGRDYLTDEWLTDRQIKDWSSERRDAYIKWRTEVQKRGG